MAGISVQPSAYGRGSRIGHKIALLSQFGARISDAPAPAAHLQKKINKHQSLIFKIKLN
jgi:hypothetical protein